jgi:hypothetical protein
MARAALAQIGHDIARLLESLVALSVDLHTLEPLVCLSKLEDQTIHASTGGSEISAQCALVDCFAGRVCRFVVGVQGHLGLRQFWTSVESGAFWSTASEIFA